MENLATDVWDSANEPAIRPNEYFGEIALDMYYCVLQKGIGKMIFDPQVHRIEDRRTAIDINLYPIAEQAVTYDLSRSTIAESRDWASITLASIKALGLTPREINGKYVRATFAPTGRKYINKQGEERENTAFKILEVFADESACRTSYTGVEQATPQAVPADDKERANAYAFLKIIVAKAVKEHTEYEAISDAITASIKSMPIVGKHFTLDSAEVTDLIMSEMAK